MEILYNQIIKWENEKNNLIMMIAGLTDPVRQEQSQSEYEMLENKITEGKIKYHDIWVENEINNTLDEYKNIFKSSDCIIKAIESINDINSAEIKEKVKKLRLRVPKHNDKRMINYFARSLGVGIILLDMEGELIDEVNMGDICADKKKECESKKIYKIILHGFMRFDDFSGYAIIN